MRAPDFQPLAAGVAAFLLIASIVWWSTSVPEQIDPGQPTWNGADIVQLNAAVPKIADFKEFYTNNENPFVPLNERIAETEEEKIRGGGGKKPLPPPPSIPPPRQPVIVKETIPPPPPVLVFPTLTPKPSNAPLTYGLVSVDGHQAVIVRMPGANEPITLKPSEKVSGWTLVSIDEGNFATFIDPDGIEQRFVIGEGDLAVLNSNALTSGAPQGPPAAQGVPKPPKPGSTPRPGSKPGMTDGPIPKPPMREERRPPAKEMPAKPQQKPQQKPPQQVPPPPYP